MQALQSIELGFDSELQVVHATAKQMKITKDSLLDYEMHLNTTYYLQNWNVREQQNIEKKFKKYFVWLAQHFIMCALLFLFIL